MDPILTFVVVLIIAIALLVFLLLKMEMPNCPGIRAAWRS